MLSTVFRCIPADHSRLTCICSIYLHRPFSNCKSCVQVLTSLRHPACCLCAPMHTLHCNGRQLGHPYASDFSCTHQRTTSTGWFEACPVALMSWMAPAVSATVMMPHPLTASRLEEGPNRPVHDNTNRRHVHVSGTRSEEERDCLQQVQTRCGERMSNATSSIELP